MLRAGEQALVTIVHAGFNGKTENQHTYLTGLTTTYTSRCADGNVDGAWEYLSHRE